MRPLKHAPTHILRKVQSLISFARALSRGGSGYNPWEKAPPRPHVADTLLPASQTLAPLGICEHRATGVIHTPSAQPRHPWICSFHDSASPEPLPRSQSGPLAAVPGRPPCRDGDLPRAASAPSCLVSSIRPGNFAIGDTLFWDWHFILLACIFATVTTLSC